jgi:DNA-binding transcriptional ArsR family regulator
MKLVEKGFRGSVVCRALAYPISYGIVRMLFKNGRMGLTDIVKRVKRSKPAVCYHLTKLRMVNIVRYDKEGKETFYWIKYPKYVRTIMDACEALVERATKRVEIDF